jgi:predicted aldo/keto reductase-like oxidoreductase
MQNRRNFLRNSMLALTGAGIAHRSFSTSISKPLLKDGEDHFVYRKLGNTGLEIPVVSMGTGNCDNPNLIREALDRGVKLLATHDYYQNGNNEKMVGEVLKDRPRDSCMILTGTGKGLEIDFKNGRFGSETNMDTFMESINGCLERLQVDYVDILNAPFAGSREAVFYEPVLKTLKKIKKQGKARFIGMASHNIEHEAILAAADSDIYDLVTIAYNFRKTNLQEMEEAMQYAADKGLGIIGMKTMAGVYWDKEQKQAINTRAALKWVLQNENIHTTIPDCSTFDELHQDLDVMADMGLKDEEIRDLDPPAGDTSSGLYCQQCNQCLTQCPENLNIPAIMRSYMYAYGYRNLGLAQQTMDQAGPDHLYCKDCRECLVNCRMGFDIRGKILDIDRIRDIPEDMIWNKPVLRT